MPRRYGADGTRLWNGKTPEEFTEADAYRFMAEPEAVLQRKTDGIRNVSDTVLIPSVLSVSQLFC